MGRLAENRYRCDACGRTFVISYQHLYKLNLQDKVRHFCRWTCYNRIYLLKQDKQYEEINTIFEEARSKWENENN